MKNSLKTLTLVLSAIPTTSLFANDIGDFKAKVSSFQDLWNQVSEGAADPTPWAGSYFAFGTDGIAEKIGDQSPAQRFDKWMGTSGRDNGHKWEVDNHSCRMFRGEEKRSCESWWGHCNAWAASAIKDPEPRKGVTSKGIAFGVGDQKALLTEIWMESGSLFAGDTDKSTKIDGAWIADPNDRRSKKVTGWAGRTVYDAFWDVTPRAFFLILTNYVGLNKQGVVIDRFTGDEVWNHPVVGYKFLPLRQEDLGEVTQNGKTLYSANLRVKMFWTEDGVPADHLSQKFELSKIKDTEAIESFYPDFSGRYLSFKLYFDAPVVIENGKITSAGRITGPGLWGHQENPVREMNETHPDFMWYPVDLNMGAASGSRNPYVGPEEVYQIVNATGGGDRPAPSDTNGSLGDREGEFETVHLSLNINKLGLRVSSDSATFPVRVKAKLMKVFRRANVLASMDVNEIEVKSRVVRVPVKFFGRNGEATLRKVLEEAGIL